MSVNLHASENCTRTNNRQIPSDDTSIIRYMDFSKFMHLLTFKKMYFRNVKKYEDKYEGKLPDAVFKNFSKEEIASCKEVLKDFEEKRIAYVNCWNNFENTESYALWRIYTNPEAGIAIKSNVKRLMASLSDDSLSIFTVKYIKSFDGSEDITIPYVQKKDSYFAAKEACKFNAYEYEKEIRVIKYVNLGRLKNKDEAEDGVDIPVDVNELIEEIYISPYASDWFEKLVKQIVSQPIYDLQDKPIFKSKILFN